MKINKVVFVVLMVLSIFGLLYIGFDVFQIIQKNSNQKSIDLIPVYKSIQIPLTNNKTTSFEVKQNSLGKYDIILNSKKIYEINDTKISSIIGYSNITNDRIIYGYLTDKVIGNINPYKVILLEKQNNDSYTKIFEDINIANINNYGNEIIVSKIFEHKKGMDYLSGYYIMNYQLVKKNNAYVLELVITNDKYLGKVKEIKND